MSTPKPAQPKTDSRSARKILSRVAQLVMPGRFEIEKLRKQNLTLATQLQRQKEANEKLAEQRSRLKDRIDQLQKDRQAQAEKAQRLQHQCDELERIAVFLHDRVRSHGGLEVASGNSTS